MRGSGGDEVMELRLLLRGREGVGGARPALLAEGEAQLARWAEPLGGVGAERRAGLVETQSAQHVAPEEACLARHLAALRHLPRRPPISSAATIQADAGQAPPGRSRKWRGNRGQVATTLQIAASCAH